MAAEYLEIAKTSERDTRTLVQMCHNFKNIVLVKESFDDKTELWHTKNGFIIPVNYILESQFSNIPNRTIYFSLQKRQKNEFPYAHRYYGCIAPIQTKKQDVKKLSKRTNNFLQSTITIALKFGRVNWGS